ncbi:MAG TPA: hypothetical protein VJU77_04655 [Chthoniobacterales bacterium]|nr:hypothetical protein [Chthoniobacterales bacterium]
MQSRSPELSAEQISKWMREAAKQPRATQTQAQPHLPSSPASRHPGFDFRSTRQSLNRARAKNDIDTIKPLRRLRRNQGAINEALADALSALIAVNKQMAGEITALSGELSRLRGTLAASDLSDNRAEVTTRPG